MSKTIWVAVRTNKRAYSVVGGHLVVWLPGEKVISIEVIQEESC